MTMVSRRSTIALVAAVLAALGTAGCGSGSHGPTLPSESDLASSSDVRSQVIVTQFVVDTGFLPGAELGPGAVVNGVVADNAQFTTWYGAGQNHLLSQGSRVAIYQETPKVAAALRHLPQLQSAADRKAKVPPWTPEQTARAVLVQEMVDATFVSGAVAQGLTDSSDHVISGSALDSWYTAHDNDRLPGSSDMTLADEVTRIVTAIGTLKP